MDTTMNQGVFLSIPKSDIKFFKELAKKMGWDIDIREDFLKDYIDIDVDVKQLAEDMTRVGNEYDSASNLINATKLVIGQITECEPHPDSDHLHLCKVNI